MNGLDTSPAKAVPTARNQVRLSKNVEAYRTLALQLARKDEGAVVPLLQTAATSRHARKNKHVNARALQRVESAKSEVKICYSLSPLL